MATNCGHYFLTATALRIWREGDAPEEANLHACLFAQKKLYFSRVIKDSRIPVETHGNMADEAFNDAYMALRLKAVAGGLEVKNEDFGGFFYGTFKNKYYKLVFKELRRLEILAKFGGEQPMVEGEKNPSEPSPLQKKVLEILGQMGEDCQELLDLRLVEEFTLNEIVQLKGANSKETVSQALWRCKERFMKRWMNL